MIRGLVLLTLLGIIPVQAGADELIIEGPAQRMQVLELYTSHGCNSCPPADEWLRGLTGHPGLWTRLAPMAFHVDYWDGLGWKDRFARPEFSQRQRDYRLSGAIRSVYTPGFVLNGREWRLRRSEALAVARGEQVGRLRLHLSREGDSLLEHLDPGTTQGPFEAHMAILGFGLASRIGAGENAGRTLEEDFVVLGSSHAGQNELAEWHLPWPELKSARPKRQAVVAWISRPGAPDPVQAVAGWLPE